MPSVPSAAPTSPPPSDSALVERAARGDRQALAILYARHAPGVHARAVQAGVTPAAAARVLRDVFREAGRSVGSPTAASEPRVWLRGLTMDRLAGSAAPGTRLDPATARAAQDAGLTLTPQLRDAVWRELERGWNDDQLPFWRRQPATLAATSLVGLLLVAVVVVGLLVREQIRPVAPARAVALTAEPVEEPVAQPEEPPPPAPSVIVPPLETEEPFVAPEETEEPAPSPSPEPEPSPTETAGASPSPGEGTESPSEDDSDDPLLPLPGPGAGSGEPPSPSPSPSPSPTEASTESAGAGGEDEGT